MWDLVDFTKLFKMRACKNVIYGKEIDVAIWTARWEEIGNDVCVCESRVTYTKVG